MKYLRFYDYNINENNDQNVDITMNIFKEKYDKYIQSGDIIIKKGTYLEISIKKDLNLPELRNDILKMLFTKDKDFVNGYESYYVQLPLKMDFGDVITIDYNEMQKLIQMTPENLKNELQNKYNQTFKNQRFLDTMKKRKIFEEYL